MSIGALAALLSIALVAGSDGFTLVFALSLVLDAGLSPGREVVDLEAVIGPYSFSYSFLIKSKT